MRKAENLSDTTSPTPLRLEQILLRGLAAGEVGVWNWDRRSQRVYWTPNLEGIHQLPPGRFDGTFRFFERDIHPDDRDRVMRAVEAAVAEGGPYRVEYRLLPQEQEEPRWLEARGQVIEDDGTVVGMTGICEDVTERKRSVIELQRRTGQQEAMARLGQLAISDCTEQELFDAVAREAAAALDVEMSKILELLPGGDELLLRAGVGWKPGLVGSARLAAEGGSQAGYTLKAGGSVVVTDLTTETRFDPPPLLRDHGVLSGLSVLIVGEEGRPFGMLGAHSTWRQKFNQFDVDFLNSLANLLSSAIRRNRAVERQELLVRELRHRVGNLLALISSLFQSSARGAQSVADLEDRFLARLMALARTHAMIAQGGWGQTCLHRLVDCVLEPYADRLEVSGVDVGISAEHGLALSLALHELATNAAKYGALSVAEGSIAVSWSVGRAGDNALITLDWIERGGPEITPPANSGFGTKLVSAVIERQLNGAVSTEFAPSGLRARFEFPMNS